MSVERCKLWAKLCLCLSLTFLFAFTPHFSAQAFTLGKDKNSTSFGVLNISYIMSESLAAKSLNEQLTAELNALKEENDIKEGKLLQAYNKVLEKKEELPEDEYQKLEASFTGKVDQLKEIAQKKREDIEKRSAEALAKLRGKILAISKDILDAEGYEAIFAQENIVLLKKQVNVTPAVLERLNAEMPDLKM